VVGLALTAVDPAFDHFLTTDIPALVDAFPAVQFCFVPMSRHPRVRRHNDAHLARALARHAPRLAVLDGDHHPAELLALFGCLDAAVCMRFHSFIFAARMGTPIIGVPYAEKCRNWLFEHEIRPVPPAARDVAAALDEALMAAPAAALAGGK
jgi:polysaccharide pyruvyl transferase WcaK-like protein